MGVDLKKNDIFRKEVSVMPRIMITVDMKNIYEYTRPAFAYGTETAYIYTMTGEDGTEYVWKTTTWLAEKVPDTSKMPNYIDSDGKGYKKLGINKGDKVQIKATIKGQSEYNGTPQTELTRVTLVKRLFKAETYEERQARIKAEKEAKAKEQRSSLTGEDFICRMSYKQYKEHYSDCETVEGSYLGRDISVGRNTPTIEVIIREGRLKKSGVRGKHYKGFELTNEEGVKHTYYAISEETAIKRAMKEHKGGNWTCTKIYNYQRY